MTLILMITLVSLLALCATPLVLIMVCFKSSSADEEEERIKKAMAEARAKKEKAAKFDELKNK